MREAKAPQVRQAGPNRLGQRHLDSWWVKKNGPSHYRYKSSISIDVTCGLMGWPVLNPASIHDSQMLPALVDGRKGVAMGCSDSAYQSTVVESVLQEAGYESGTEEKGSGQDLLDGARADRKKG